MLGPWYVFLLHWSWKEIYCKHSIDLLDKYGLSVSKPVDTPLLSQTPSIHQIQNTDNRSHWSWIKFSNLCNIYLTHILRYARYWTSLFSLAINSHESRSWWTPIAKWEGYPNDRHFSASPSTLTRAFLWRNLVSCVIAHVMVVLRWFCTLLIDYQLQRTNNKYAYKSPTDKIASMTVPTSRPSWCQRGAY